MRTLRLSVHIDKDVDLPRVMEVLSRTGLGLLMEGLDIQIFAYTDDDDDDYSDTELLWNGGEADG